MKKIILIALALCISVDVYAFGGGGHSRSSKRYQYGVDAIGTHINPDNPIVPPDFRDCKEEETAVIGKCCPNNLVYTENGTNKCCDALNHIVREGECVNGADYVGTGVASWWIEGNTVIFTWDQADKVGDVISVRGTGSWRLVYDGDKDTYKVILKQKRK